MTQRGIALAVVWSLFPGAAAAGPWVRELGDGFVQVSYRHFEAAAGFNELTGGLGLPFRSDAAELYAEVGLPLDFQVIVSLPVVRATNILGESQFLSHTWTGDLKLEVDYALWRELPLSLGAEVRLPTYKSPLDHGGASGMNEDEFAQVSNQFPALGDGGVDLTLKVLIGMSLTTIPGWVTLQGGPRIRFGGYASGFWAAADAGVWIYEHLIGIGTWVEGVFNFGRLGGSKPTKELLYIQGKVLFQDFLIDGFGLTLHAATVAAASNASVGSDFGTSLYFTF